MSNKKVKFDVMEDEEPLYDIDELDEKPDNPTVLKSYQTASSIANEVLKQLLQNIKVGVKIHDLCKKSDEIILSLCSKVKEVKKSGIAFPTTICNGRIICNYTPLDNIERRIRSNDEIKIELGVHINGYVAITGTTIYSSPSNETPLMSRKITFDELVKERCRLIFLSRTLLNLTVRMMLPGMDNIDIGKMCEKFCAEKKVSFLQGILSHEISRYVVDGVNVILHAPTKKNKVNSFKFAKNSIFVIDIALSSNINYSGIVREENITPCIMKREVKPHTSFVKFKTSKDVLTYIDSNHDCFPFTLRNIPTSKRLGVKELRENGMLMPLPVLHRRKHESVVRLITTVMITHAKVIMLTEPYVQNNMLKYNENLGGEYKKILGRKLKFDQELFT